MAAGSTYTPIATSTLGSAQSTVTFSGIASSYTDLILVINGTASSTNNHFVRFNNDSASNYSYTDLYGDGGSAGTGRATNSSGIFIGNGSGTNYTKIVQIMNYSNTTTNKTALNRSNSPTEAVATQVGMWRSTAAINRVDIVATGGSMNTGTIFTLYGLAAA
jgi:hypothetical protein